MLQPLAEAEASGYSAKENKIGQILPRKRADPKTPYYDRDFIEKRIAELTATDQFYLEEKTPIQFGGRVRGKVSQRILLNSEVIRQTRVVGGYSVQGVEIPYQFMIEETDESQSASFNLNPKNMSRYQFLIGGSWQTLEGRLPKEQKVIGNRPSTTETLSQNL